MNEKYKYNTLEEFLYDYAMGNPYIPEECSPEVIKFASKHNFDIPKMRQSLETKNKITFEFENDTQKEIFWDWFSDYGLDHFYDDTSSLVVLDGEQINNFDFITEEGKVVGKNE